ncbi:MAG: hypothetical protein IIA89_12660 [Chloroflexi bacterium]|nr:hypothetical protein [Chloroflexota bacterium]
MSEPLSTSVVASKSGVERMATGILGRAGFDLTTVVVSTLKFGPNGAGPAHDLTDPIVYADHLQDVNGDGFTDLVSHYRTQETGIDKVDTDACLAWETAGGMAFLECESIKAVGK